MAAARYSSRYGARMSGVLREGIVTKKTTVDKTGNCGRQFSDWSRKQSVEITPYLPKILGRRLMHSHSHYGGRSFDQAESCMPHFPVFSTEGFFTNQKTACNISFSLYNTSIAWVKRPNLCLGRSSSTIYFFFHRHISPPVRPHCCKIFVWLD